MKKCLLLLSSIILTGCSAFMITTFITNNFTLNETPIYNITYELQGGENHESNLDSLSPESSFTLSPATKTGYNFMGWYDNFGNKITSIDKLNKNITLYAKWTIDSNYYGSIPLIEITTQDSVAPYDKENYINCSFKLSNCNNQDHEFEVEMAPSFDDDSDEQESVGIRLRGNSTIVCEKKPYRIKFEKKTSILGLKKNKSWVLLADYFDLSGIKNYTALTLASYFDDMAFNPTPNHVVVYLNNEYKGLYILTEQIDENSGRTDVKEDFNTTTDSDFPFLVEMNRTTIPIEEAGCEFFEASNETFFHPLEIKYPEIDERNPDNNSQDVVFDYIKDYMTAVFYTLRTGSSTTFQDTLVTFQDLVDVDSFIDYYIFNEITYNTDGTTKSVFMSKTKNGKLTFGPVWDFDGAFGGWTGDMFERSLIQNAEKLLFFNRSMFSYFLQNESNYLKVVARWNVIKNNILTVSQSLKDYKPNVIDLIVLNNRHWYGGNSDIIADYKFDYVRLFLVDRYNYLESILTDTNHSYFIS